MNPTFCCVKHCKSVGSHDCNGVRDKSLISFGGTKLDQKMNSLLIFKNKSFALSGTSSVVVLKRRQFVDLALALLVRTSKSAIHSQITVFFFVYAPCKSCLCR